MVPCPIQTLVHESARPKWAVSSCNECFFSPLASAGALLERSGVERALSDGRAPLCILMLAPRAGARPSLVLALTGAGLCQLFAVSFRKLTLLILFSYLSSP